MNGLLPTRRVAGRCGCTMLAADRRLQRQRGDRVDQRIEPGRGAAGARRNAEQFRAAASAAPTSVDAVASVEHRLARLLARRRRASRASGRRAAPTRRRAR